MKKKLFDFTLSTAIIVLLAYVIIFIFLIFTIINADNVPIGSILFTIFLGLSLALLVINYGFMPIILTESKIIHKKNSIDKNNATWGVRRNYRYRYDEIVFRDKLINYKKLPKKEIKRSEIIVQYSQKYIIYLDKFLGPCDESIGE